MISVIIPLYNKEKSIIDTVNSVLNQSYRDFELIIVNDGSTDNSLSVIESIKDSRIIIINKNNGGVSSARNLGILSAKSEYLAFLDGDDIWDKDHLLEIKRLIQYNKNILIYATGFQKITNKQNINIKNNESEIIIIDNFFDYENTTKTLFSSSSFAINIGILKNMNLFYNEKYKFGEDVDFWYRIAKGNRILLSSKITSFYFLASENRSDYVMPIKFRFHLYDFDNKSLSEKKYLGKLVALIMIDYLFLKDYKTVFKIYIKYFSQTIYILRYMILLIIKKIRSI